MADELADRMRASFRAGKHRADVLEGRLADERVVLAKPRTYMNESGAAVSGLVRYYGPPLDHVVVIHDELDLPYGGLRLKLGGGDNGHNGLKSIRGSLGTGEFHRVRVGIGRPPGRMDPAAFVLRDFAAEERKTLALEIDRAADAVEALVATGLEAAQNAFNT